MKTVKQIEETSRQVFMAGLGVCGLGKDYAVHKLDSLLEDFNGFVNELLVKGEEVETDIKVKDRVQMVKERRVAIIRKQLGLNDPQLSELDQLSQKLDMLTKVIDKLAEQKAAEQAATEKVEAEKIESEKAPVAQTVTEKTEKPTETVAKAQPTPVTTEPATPAAASKPPRTTRRASTRKNTTAAKQETNAAAPAKTTRTTTKRAANKPAAKPTGVVNNKPDTDSQE